MKINRFGILGLTSLRFNAETATGGGAAPAPAASPSPAAAPAAAEAPPAEAAAPVVPPVAPAVAATAAPLSPMAKAKQFLTSQGALIGQITGLRSQVGTLEQQLAAANITIGQLTIERDGFQTQHAELEQLVATLEGGATTVAAGVVDQLAALGVPAAELPSVDGKANGGDSSKELLAQYNAITDPTERGAFFRKHEAQLLV